MNEAVLVIDEAQRLVLFNRGAEEMFGYAASEVLGQPLGTLLPELGRPDYRRRIDALPPAPGAYRVIEGHPEIRGRRKDGSRFPAQAALFKAMVGHHTYVAGVIYDLGNFPALRESFEFSSAHDRALVTQDPVGFVFIDREGTWLEVNLTAAILLGYGREQLIGRHFETLTHPDDAGADRQLLRRVIAGEIPFYTREKRYLRKDGTAFWADVTVAPLRTPGNEIQHLVVVIEDSSARRWKELGAIIDKAVNEIYLFDAETLRFLFANESACRNLGYTRQELQALTPLDVKPELAPASFAALLQALRNGAREQVSFTTVHRRKNGTLYDVQVRLQPTLYAGRPAFLAITEDVTEQLRAKDQLRLSEEQFASAFEHAAIGMALVAPDGRWLKVNRALCELTGYSEPELLSLTFQDITHPDDLEADLNFVRQMLAGQIRTYQMEKRYFHKRGHIVWILLSVSLVRDNQGRPLYFIAQIQNITERKAAEAALRESEERFRTAVANSPGAIFRATPDGWHVMFVSDAVRRITGYTPEEFAALHEGPLEEFYHPADLPGLKAAIAESMAQKQATKVEYRFRHKDGELRWALERARPVLDEAGRIKWFDGIITDLTELKRAQAESLRMARLATLGRIGSSITHELNQPLNMIAMAAENALMTRESGSPPDANYLYGKFETIHTHAMRMGSIVNHLRVFGRGEPTQLDDLDLAKVVRRAVDLARTQTKLDEIEVIVGAPEACRPVSGNSIDLETVVLNLLSNSRDAIIERQARLKETGKDLAGRIHIAIENDPLRSTIVLRVSDNGGGIPEQVLPHVFDPFFSTKEVGKGMGLGLSITYQIVTRMGGDIEASNGPEGAVFQISLPVKQTTDKATG